VGHQRGVVVGIEDDQGVAVAEVSPTHLASAVRMRARRRTEMHTIRWRMTLDV
jgi:hypothetical protein